MQKCLFDILLFIGAWTCTLIWQCLSLLNLHFVLNTESRMFWMQVSSGFLFKKIHTNGVWMAKISSSNLNMCIPMKLHTNACNYQISKFCMCVTTCNLHVLALSTNTTCRLHSFYACVGAAILLTRTVFTC